MAPPQSAKHPHISRIDRESNGTHCWKVLVRRKNRVSDRNFSDGIYGGKQKALRAAIAWRDELLLELERVRVLPNHEHLTRIERGGKKFCWQVQFQCREQFIRQYFHDEAYGGKIKARVAAMDWRDAMLAISKHDRWLRNTTMARCNNQSGTVGVGRVIDYQLVEGKEKARAYWYADWYDPQLGKRIRRKFSVLKYGEGRAESLAIATRKAGMAAVIEAQEQRLNRAGGSLPVLDSKTAQLLPVPKGIRAAVRSLVQPAV
jgi:hypothetical protein